MFEFLIRNSTIKGAQKSIDRLDPKVNIHMPKDLPLPSVGVIKRMAGVVSQINGLEPETKNFSDEELKNKTQDFKQRIQAATQQQQQKLQTLDEEYAQATSHDQREQISEQISEAQTQLSKQLEVVLNDILPEAFAVVRETGRRSVSMRQYDVQLVGGMCLHEGKIAEMVTGEGKTLVATAAAYLNALSGRGVHVITVNDYLAQRDRDWMGPIYEFLGLTVGAIQHDMMPSERQGAYGCDITYGTNNEFGFDYLRDNMVISKKEMVQRGHNFAVVDEVDSILIDEARTPLIISGPAEESTDKYYKANEVAKKLKGRKTTEAEQIDAKYKGEDLSKGYDYIADEKARSVSLTEDGEKSAATFFGIEDLHTMETIEYRHHILQALKAREFFRMDVDYVVREGKVLIVDEFTGRLMPGRRWSDGLHQAVEAKEGIKIERENQTLATITFQNYFRMYKKLSGMTGTANTEATEFKQIYDLDCLVIPTNKILHRTNYADQIYRTPKDKHEAVVEEIAELHEKGQPILVGTISIEKSEVLSSLLNKRGVPHEVLNAKYHGREAQIIAQAGRYKAVTIATNMAGRGTDIVLGGNPENLAKNLLEQKAAEDATPEEREALYQKFYQEFKTKTDEEQKKVIEAGGLHVLGTERHESRRIDNQLRGRSGRQGDPGSSRFYVSLEDDLMRLFASDRIRGFMDRFGMEGGQVLEHPLLTRSLEIAQKRVETFNFEIRKQLLDFDNVMNKQREAVYGLRRSILESASVKDRIMEAIEEIIAGVVQQYLFNIADVQTGEAQWDAKGLNRYLRSEFGLDLSAALPQWKELSKEEVQKNIFGALTKIYEQKEEDVGIERLRHVERMILLTTIDAKWKDHLYSMDQLKEGIGLRAFGQRDPKLEYQKEGFAMFQEMFASISQEVAETVFKIQIRKSDEERAMKSVFGSLPQETVHNDFSASQAAAQAPQQSPAPGQPPPQQPPKPQPIRKAGPKVGRNDPCPCGSGKKYKKCCGQ